MSHTIPQTGFPYAPAMLTIVNYTSGGETISPLEFGAHTFNGVVFGLVPAGSNSLGSLLFPIVAGGKVQLFRFVSGVPTEIPTTTALNAVLVGFLFG